MADHRPEIRLSDADRDAVVERLGLAMSEGRIDVTEFEQRSRLAYGALVSSDLDPLVADLPVPPTPPAPVVVPAMTTVRDLPAPKRDRRWLVSVFGRIDRTGAWRPGSRTIAITVFDDVRLDFTEVQADAVELVTITVFGDVRVTVDPDTHLDAGGLSIFGYLKDSAGVGPADASKTVRVRRFSVFGDLKLRRR